MSFADELKKKAGEYDPNAKKDEDVEYRIRHGINAIKRSCESAISNGKRRIDGFIYYDEYDSHFDNVCEKKVERTTGLGFLLEKFTDDQEKQIIEGIQNNVKEMGFDNFVVKSYHPKTVIGRYEWKWTIFGGRKHVGVPRYTYGFCIEVHIEW